MSNTHQTLGVIYEARRQARGPGRPAPKKLWMKRIIWGSVIVFTLAAVATVLYVRWSMHRINTVQARVWASVVSLSPESNGTLAEMLARPGDKVQIGQTLARLDDSLASASYAAAQAELQIRESLFEQAKADLELTRARIETQIEQAKLSVHMAEDRVQSARTDLELRRTRIPAEIRRSEAQRDQAKALLAKLVNGPSDQQVEAAKVKLDTEKTLLELYRIELDWSQKLYERQMESMHMVQTTRTKVNAQENRVKEMELNLTELEAGARPEELEAASHELTSREAALEIARTAAKELENMEAALSMREAELKLAEAEQKRAEKLTLEVTRADERKKAAEAELQKAQADARARKRALENLSIKSTVDGTVIRTFQKPGEFCRTGDPLVLVADDSAGKWVECFVRENDALRVRVGQPARVELIAGRGEIVQAEVVAVGLLTQTPMAGESGATSQARAGAELVWVKLSPTGELGANQLGLSARAIIYTK